jgi:hypothetical protein
VEKTLIPSLYNFFLHSDTLFKDFVLGSSKFIAIVQDLVEHIYPEVDYTIKKDNAILLLVCPHCKGNLTDLRRELHLSLAKGNPK